jgi:hypothetical protein
MFVVVDGAKEHQARAEAATTGVSPTLRRHGACCARRPWGAIGRTISPFSVAAVRLLAGNAAPRLLRLERKQCALLQFPPALSQRGWCRRRRTGVLAAQAITVVLRHHRRGATPCRQPPRAPRTHGLPPRGSLTPRSAGRSWLASVSLRDADGFRAPPHFSARRPGARPGTERALCRVR